MTAVDDEARADSGRGAGSGEEPVARDGGCGAAFPVAGGPGNNGAGASGLVTGRGRSDVSGTDDTGPADVFAGIDGPGAEGGAVGTGGKAEVLGAEGADRVGDE